ILLLACRQAQTPRDYGALVVAEELGGRTFERGSLYAADFKGFLSVEVAHLSVEVLIGAAALVVEVDQAFQGRFATVMHIGRGAKDAAQRRRLEGTDQFRIFVPRGQPSKPTLANGGDHAGLDADAQVVELVIGEVIAAVTQVTLALAEEKRSAMVKP